MTSERQHVNQQLAQYGGVMYEAFKHMIALKRWEKAGGPKTPQEKMARGVSVHSMARFKRLLPREDWQKIERFTVALNEANLADSEDTIIDDVLYRLGAGRITTA
jgi:hypothetical protein